MNLICAEESPELFAVQQALLQDYYSGANYPNTALKVALLQTLPPIEDYEEAVNVLLEFQNEDAPFEYKIIGAYLGERWFFDKSNIFLNELLCSKGLNPEQLSMVWYIDAMRLEKTGQDPIKSLKLSVKYCQTYVNNFLMLSRYEKSAVKAKQYLEFAKKNVQAVLMPQESEHRDIGLFIEPARYIRKYITGVIMEKGTYCEAFGPL